MTALAQLLLFALWAPLLNGVIKKTKAWLQRRRGPVIWQPYADLRKFSRKQMVIPAGATWLFHSAPYIVAATTAAAVFLVPGISAAPPLLGTGDLLLLVGLLALGRFALVLASLEPGSAFGGMGASREVAVAAFIEPTLLLTLAAYVLRVGSTDLGTLAGGLARAVEPGVGLARAGLGAYTPGHLLAGLALLVVAVAETGRVPVDNPDTHLELTMIHEGMVLEYSGPYLALILWARDLKQLIMLTLLADLVLPLGIGAAAYIAIPALLAKTLLFGLLLAFIETGLAKVRILKIPDLLLSGAALALLAVLADLRLGG